VVVAAAGTERAMKQTPRIMKSTLTKPPQWFLVTRYRIKDGIDAVTGEKTRYMVAQQKYDVTDQMRAILKAER
jgi:hypothetical protein